MAKKKKEEMPLETFASGLATWFKRLRARNIETLGMGMESVKDMNQDELMKLDWELCILDMFIITYCCRSLIEDKKTSDKVLYTFHNYVYGETFTDIDPTDPTFGFLLTGLTFQEESEIRYKTYFEAMETKDQAWNICKEVGKNIFGEPFQSSVKIGAINIYFKANFKFTIEWINRILKECKLAEDNE